MSTQTGDPTPTLGGLLADVPLPLLQATRRALETLARHWPKAMAAAVGRSEAADAFVRDYALACQGADLDAVGAAAQQWVATGKYYPKPAELGTLARNLSRPGAPTPTGTAPHVRDAEAALQAQLESGRVQAMNAWAYKRLGSYVAVAAVWERLLQQATQPQQQALVHQGRVNRQDFAEAVAAIKAEREAAAAPAPLPGPLGDTLAATLGAGA